MRRQLAALAILAVLLGSLATTLPLGASASAAPKAPSLFLTLLPPRLPADGNSYPAFVVSLRDASGNPTVSTSDTSVYLASSEEAVLSVVGSIIIPAGAQFATANVQTTLTPGSSNITAASNGFVSASATMRTFIPRGYPAQLRVFALPSALPAGKTTTAAVAVAVVDQAGLPARTAQSTTAQLTSSDTSELNVGTSNVTIPFDKTMAYGSFSTTGKAGVAAITATSSGFVSGSTLVTISKTKYLPFSLLVSVGPGTLPADGGTYDVVSVSIVDNKSEPLAAPSTVHVLLTSSRTDLVTVPYSVDIPSGSSYALATLNYSPATGFSKITASASGYASSSAVVETVSIPPSKLGLFLSDSNALISANARTLDLAVQLQDESGDPALARTPAAVTITFSNSTLLKVPVTLTVPKGSNVAYTNVTLAAETMGSFGAITPGLDSAFSQFSATVLGVTKGITSSAQTIYANQTATLTFSLQDMGVPLSGAALSWSSTDGRIEPSSSSTDGMGTSSATFMPSSAGVAIVTVTATHPVVGSVNSSLAIVVIPAPQGPTLVQRLFGYIPYIAVAAVASLLVVFLLLRRRRREEPAEEGFETTLGEV